MDTWSKFLSYCFTKIQHNIYKKSFFVFLKKKNYIHVS